MRYWKRVNQNNETTTVESYSHNKEVEGATEIDEAEYKNYIASLPVLPRRDLLQEEIDDIKAKLKAARVAGF